MSKRHLDAMRMAAVVVQRQTDVLEGATKLYGASPDKEANAYREMAHAALDALLDAHRSKHFYLELAMRNPEEDE